jgi:hypothetical protein
VRICTAAHSNDHLAWLDLFVTVNARTEVLRTEARLYGYCVSALTSSTTVAQCAGGSWQQVNTLDLFALSH